ncbi:MAG: hypothetical protein H6R07_1758 [Proteobacteria bacterium]|nr:hypothetical protein [Pseudomonadota bacterium]
MQWRLVSVFPCLFLASMVARADEAVTELPETVITAARVPQPQREVLGDVTLITRKDLELQRGQSLVDVLSAQPGIQFSSNGGKGKTTSVFLRGTNTAHMLVLIDGMRYGSATTGMASLQHLPLEQVDHIEILRGAAASLYGSDAIGGVIQVFTRRGGKTPAASVEVGLGSNHTREANAQVAASIGDTRYALGVAHSETDGINVIRDPINPSYYPDRDGYSNTSASLSVSHKLNVENEVGANLLFSKSRNHFDGNVLDSFWNNVAQSYDYREESKQGAASVWSRHQLAQNWTARLQAGFSTDDSENFAPVSATDLSDKKTRFTTRQTQLGWQNDILVGPGTATLGLETLEQRVAGSTAYPVDQRRINSLLGGYLVHLGEWNLQANLRNDDNSQFGNHTSGQAGASWQFLPAWQAGGNIGTGFRAPSFNDLYYPDDGFGNKGNPNLKPEKSLNREVFIRYQQQALQAGLTLFKNRVNNLIDWAPVDASDPYGAWQPSNVGRALLRGASLQSSWQGQVFSVGGNYDWLDARDISGGSNDGKQLIYRAKHSGTVYAGITQGKWQTRVELKMVGLRYSNAANTTDLGGYSVANLATSWQFSRDWQLNARLNNIFDKDYATAKDYAMPGRNVFVSLRWKM